jgi:hypothetical protein
MEDADKALKAIREATKKRTIKKESLVEKLQRIEKCKKEFLSSYTPIYIPKIVDSFNSPDGKKIMEQYQNFLTGKV